MSPVNIMYLIIAITAVLLFVIFKYVKEPEEDTSFEPNQPSQSINSYEIFEEKKEPVDFKELKFQSDNQNLTEDEYQKFVNEHDLNLPELYKNIILISNGGEPQNKRYYKDSTASFAPIKYGHFTINDILRLNGELFLPHGFFPFIDHGEYGYAIGMNKDNLHQIYFWDETGEFVYECESLQDFLNELDEYDDY